MTPEQRARADLVAMRAEHARRYPPASPEIIDTLRLALALLDALLAALDVDLDMTVITTQTGESPARDLTVGEVLDRMEAAVADTPEFGSVVFEWVEYRPLAALPEVPE